MAEDKTGWGGKRPGAGRPKGSFKAKSEQRKQHQLRATEDEWEVIKRFATIVKTDPKRAGRILGTK